MIDVDCHHLFFLYLDFLFSCYERNLRSEGHRFPGTCHIKTERSSLVTTPQM
jgi:hypothetical protein